MTWPNFSDSRLEAMLVISCVLDNSDGTIGLYEAVISSHHIAVSFFVLFLDVPCMWIVNSVLEFVFGIGLRENAIRKCSTKILPAEKDKILHSVRGHDVEHSWRSHHNLDTLLHNYDDQYRSTAELLDCLEDLNVRKDRFLHRH